MYVIAMTAAAAAAGATFAAAGAGVAAVWDDSTVVLGIILGGVALTYALHELAFTRLPVPGRSWQVPADWVRGGFYRSAAVWGVIVGAGVFTRITFAILPVLLAWLFVTGDIAYGAAAGAAYGVTRAASIYVSARSRDSAQVVNLNQHLAQFAPPLHQTAGVALAAFAAYLLIAPNL